MTLMSSDLPILDLPCIAPTGAKHTRFGEHPLFDEGLYDLGSKLYAWMTPNGSWGESNAGLVIGRGTSLLIDTLWDMRLTRQMLNAMAAYTESAPIETVVNTHSDGDHFWGNHLVKNAEIITSETSLRQMAHHKPRRMRLFQRVGKILSTLPLRSNKKAGHWFQAMCQPYAFHEVIYQPATSSFSDRCALDIGGREVQLFEVGPAHTQGDLVVYVPDARTLFAADLLFIGVTPVIWAGPVENWLDALDRILEMDVEVIIPGHGPITNKDGVRLVKAYWEYLYHELHARFDIGFTAEKAAYDIIFDPDFASQPFANWDSPERIMTNAHVLYRHFRRKKGQMNPMQILRILHKQAILAHAIPKGRPRQMRLGRWTDSYIL